MKLVRCKIFNSNDSNRQDNQALRRVLVLVATLLLAVTACASCGTKTTDSSVGDIPLHLNSGQVKKIDQNKQDYSFAVFADNKGDSRIFPKLLKRINSENLLFAIDVGDLVDGGSIENYRKFVTQIKDCKWPFLTAFGNHDGGPGNFYEKIFGPKYYTFTAGDSFFIVLDDANQLYMGLKQFKWLQKKLAESQDSKYRFVIMHVPLFDPRAGWSGIGHSLYDPILSQILKSLFDRNNVTMLLCSHIHGYYEGTWGKTPFIITGGAGAQLQGTDPEHFFYNYVKINVSPEGVSHEVVKVP